MGTENSKPHPNPYWATYLFQRHDNVSQSVTTNAVLVQALLEAQQLTNNNLNNSQNSYNNEIGNANYNDNFGIRRDSKVIIKTNQKELETFLKDVQLHIDLNNNIEINHNHIMMM